MWCGIVVHIDSYLDAFMACLKEIKDPFGGDKQTKEMSKGSS